MTLDKVSAADEEKLRARIESLTGGEIVGMERQVRWRPSWFVDVKSIDKRIKLYVRGDRQSDVVPFPDLKREADIIRVLGEQGIPMPHIYGMCEDPVAIIMEASPGTRDVTTASSDEERKSVARQYIDALVAMHRLPLEPFAEIGITIPQTPEEIALAGLEAYMPLYLRQKVAPEPFIEFSMKWLRTNIPKNRTKPSFIAFDAGQFLFDKGKVTALYDFEFAMIGDAMTDIATMAMRHSHENMGEDIDALCEYYSEKSGEPVDTVAIRYHHALFATVACMQFVGAIANPKPGDPHDVYLEWTLALRKSLINVLAENMGVSIVPPARLQSQQGNYSNLYTMMSDMTNRLPVVDESAAADRNSLLRLSEYIAKVDCHGRELECLALDDARQFVGECCSIQEMEEKLERHVQQADPDDNAVLLQFFANQIERQVYAYGSTSIGQSASHIRLESLT